MDKEDQILALLQEIKAELAALSQKIETPSSTMAAIETELTAHHSLASLTGKQHVTMQIVLRGLKNQAIADVFGVSINTAKVHIRSTAKKFGVLTRKEMLPLAIKAMAMVTDEEYKKLSGGLPKDWAENHLGDPSYRSIYMKGG